MKTIARIYLSECELRVGNLRLRAWYQEDSLKKKTCGNMLSFWKLLDMRSPKPTCNQKMPNQDH